MAAPSTVTLASPGETRKSTTTEPGNSLRGGGTEGRVADASARTGCSAAAEAGCGLCWLALAPSDDPTVSQAKAPTATAASAPTVSAVFPRRCGTSLTALA